MKIRLDVLGLIGALLFNAAVVGWYASQVFSRLSSVEQISKDNTVTIADVKMTTTKILGQLDVLLGHPQQQAALESK